MNHFAFQNGPDIISWFECIIRWEHDHYVLDHALTICSYFKLSHEQIDQATQFRSFNFWLHVCGGSQKILNHLNNLIDKVISCQGFQTYFPMGSMRLSWHRKLRLCNRSITQPVEELKLARLIQLSGRLPLSSFHLWTGVLMLTGDKLPAKILMFYQTLSGCSYVLTVSSTTDLHRLPPKILWLRILVMFRMI